jgi:hypothetical protein
MRPAHVSELLDTMILAEIKPGERKETMLFLGSPGIGKTSLPIQAAKKHNLFMIFFHPLFSEPIDLTGVPHVVLNGRDDNAKTFWANPGWIPDETPKGYSGVMVLVDEATQCDPPMMKACAPIFEEHRIGTKILPHGTIVVATGNRAGDRAGASKLLSHVKSRIVEIQVDTSVEDFIEWGSIDDRVIPQVRYFLQFKSECLNTFNPSSEAQYATPRGWHKVSRLYPILPSHLQSETLTGVVGSGPSAEFLAFCRVWEELSAKFDIDKILEKPEKAPIPKSDQIDVMWALVGSVAEKAKASPGITNCIQAMKYFSRFSREFSFIGIQNIGNHVGEDRFQQLCRHAEYQKWFKNNQELLNEARTANSK